MSAVVDYPVSRPEAETELASCSWPLRKLADLTTKVGSGSTPRGGDAVYRTSGIPLIRSMNVHFTGFKPEGLVCLDEEEARKLSNVTVQARDVLLNITGASIGRVTTAPENLAGARVNQHVCIIRPSRELDPSFLALFLSSPSQQMRVMNIQVGATRQALTKAMVLNWDVPVPPLKEQQRIVAEIEKQFTRLDTGVTALRRMQSNLKRYRAAVLKVACDGRLVPIEATWGVVPLSELIKDLGQGWSPKCDLNREPLPHEWAVITTTAVQSMRYIDNQGKPLPDALKPRPHLEIAAGDMLMTRKGPRQRAGVACLVRATRPRMMVCDTVYRFRCREEIVFAPFLEMALNSPPIVAEIDKRKAGINESGVSLTHEKLGSVMMPLPTLSEQMLIVAEAERRLSVIEELESVVNANLQRATRLRQSVLQRAFSGAL